MKLYRAYSLIDSSRLLSGQNPETFVKVDWVCYLRDEPLVPYHQLIENYQGLPETGKEKLWILRRANYFLSEQEVDELKLYLEKQYSFSIEVEELKLPLKVEQIPKFDEQDITGDDYPTRSGRTVSSQHRDHWYDLRLPRFNQY